MATRVGIPASLLPAESSWEFPIVLRHGEFGRFELELKMQIPGSRAKIETIELTPVSRDRQVIAALSDANQLQQTPNPQVK